MHYTDQQSSRNMKFSTVVLIMACLLLSLVFTSSGRRSGGRKIDRMINSSGDKSGSRDKSSSGGKSNSGGKSSTGGKGSSGGKSGSGGKGGGESKEGLPLPRDCWDLRCLYNVSKDGVYQVYPTDGLNISVLCDMATDGGGWTIFQQRYNGTVMFNRTYVEYENGFGDLHTEFWLGNDFLHQFTSNENQTLRFDFCNEDNSTQYAIYYSFAIGNGSDCYRLHVADYLGTAGDPLIVFDSGTDEEYTERDVLLTEVAELMGEAAGVEDEKKGIRDSERQKEDQGREIREAAMLTLKRSGENEDDQVAKSRKKTSSRSQIAEYLEVLKDKFNKESELRKEQLRFERDKFELEKKRKKGNNDWRGTM